jgi:hypothetical protein
MVAILGIVDSRSPGMLAGTVIGGAVVAIILMFGPELVEAIAEAALSGLSTFRSICTTS